MDAINNGPAHYWGMILSHGFRKPNLVNQSIKKLLVTSSVKL